jgi:hypothetical protein
LGRGEISALFASCAGRDPVVHFRNDSSEDLMPEAFMET